MSCEIQMRPRHMLCGIDDCGLMRSGNRSPARFVLEASPLYKAIDSLNKRFGKGKVFSARHSLTLGLARSNREPRLRGGYAEGLGDRSWQMKRTKLSKRPTTRWDELMVVR